MLKKLMKLFTQALQGPPVLIYLDILQLVILRFGLQLYDKLILTY